MLRSMIVAVLILLGANVSTYSQNTNGPSYKLDREEKRVVDLTNLYPDPDCFPAKLEGRVVAREFEQRGIVLTGVTIESDDGSRDFINVAPELESLNIIERTWIVTGLQTLFKEGNSVALGIKLCGASGRVVFVDSVRLWTKIPTKKRGQLSPNQARQAARRLS